MTPFTNNATQTLTKEGMYTTRNEEKKQKGTSARKQQPPRTESGRQNHNKRLGGEADQISSALKRFIGGCVVRYCDCSC